MIRPRRQPAKGTRAFTLVETIATMVILATLGTISSGVIWAALDSYGDGAVRSVLHSEGSAALDRMVRELHGIEKKTGGGTIAPNISSLTLTSLSWNTGDSLSLVGGELRLTKNPAPAHVLVDDITSLSIRAYNESNAALAASLSGSACDPIRRISIEFTLQREGVTEVFRTRVFLRCTMVGVAP